MRIIATAGHVDHGKSTLIRTLTGIDPDRWQEEKDRGLTIDLGFAHMSGTGTHDISFIDVPGHVRFLHNMLAGIGGIHACLFVVDAREGWMPQSEEHLRILDLLGITHGVIALTKIDLCTSDDAELTTLDISDRVAGTFLADAPIVGVSCVTGEGMEELTVRLGELADRSSPSPDLGRPRLFVDRVFAARGAGTVVTGTLTHGALQVGDQILMSPTMATGRIRSIQSLGRSVENIGPGHRVALNISGIDHHEIIRGHVVVKDDDWFVTDLVDAELMVLPTLDHPVSRRGAYTVHIGSDDIPATMRALDTDALAPGSTRCIRLRLARPLPLVLGDRFVLRESGRSETIGGGVILDVDPQRPAASARPDRTIARVVDEHGWITSRHLWRITGATVQPTVGDWVIAPATLEHQLQELRQQVITAAAEGLDIAHINDRRRLLLGLLDDVEITDGRVRNKGTNDPLVGHPAVAQLESEGCAPNPPSRLGPSDLRRLEQRGVLFERDGLWFHNSALERAHHVARTLLEREPEGFTLSQFRDALGITRKHAVPLASELDHRGITRRRGDLRISGPRL